MPSLQIEPLDIPELSGSFSIGPDGTIDHPIRIDVGVEVTRKQAQGQAAAASAPRSISSQRS